MTNITINMKKNAIEMTKAFAKKASRFGTNEYEMLQKARKDYPNLSVTIAKPSNSTKKHSFKGLTYDYMEEYIANHDNDNQSIMREYESHRGISAEAKEINAKSATYAEMKKWFLKTYPEFEAFYEKRSSMLAA